MGDHGTEGLICHIQRFSLHDGPGIRTTVFLKGCPLHCLWCDNPESQSFVPELAFLSSRCNKCSKCPAACPERAISLDNDAVPKINRRHCSACGECIKVCSTNALIMYGQRMTPLDVMQEVRRDLRYYRGSGGGVTISGGEVLAHPSFTKALFDLCRQEGIDSAIETSGFARSEVFDQILSAVNYVLFDLKYMDPLVHQRFTGQLNTLILGNARKLAQIGRPHLFRIPLIPGHNDSAENILATANFIRSVEGTNATIEIMPYHTLGRVKYAALGKLYPLDGTEALVPSMIKPIQQMFEDNGVKCLVSS